MRGTLNRDRIAATCLSVLLITIAPRALVLTGSASGQARALEQPSAKPQAVIPPPRKFKLPDPAVQRTESDGQTKPGDEQRDLSTSLVPPITPLPPSATVPDSATRRDDTGATPDSPPCLPIDAELIPGRVVQPIDLVNALRLTGAAQHRYCRHPAANLRGDGRPDGGARSLAAVTLLRAKLVPI